MEQYIKQFDDTFNSTFGIIKKTTMIKGIVHLILVLYAARLAPSLPKEILVLFENPYVKLLVFSLVLWTAQFSPSTSLLIAIAFMVTLNYANQRPLWEFLENVDGSVQQVDPTEAPLAPTKDVAIDAAAGVIQQQITNTPVVDGVAQKDNTVIIQPTIVDTPTGKAVVNPSVVIAPAMVESPSGEQMLIKPSVTVLEAPTQAGPSPSLVDEQKAGPSPSLVDVPAPSPAPVPAPSASKQQMSEPAGCYPIRRYDMSKVSGYDMSNGSYGNM